jgi:8-amino-7-oxononanoate synthase
MRERPELRARLRSNVRVLYDGLAAAGFSLGLTKSPVVAVHIDSPQLAVATWLALLNAGVYVNLALPPATPAGTALLRCSVCAAHSREQLKTVIETLTEVAYATGVLAEPSRAAVA